MRIKNFMAIPLFCGVAIFLSSCKQNFVALESTTARGEVPQLTNLTFRFNKSLYPDSLLNNWDSASYISFEPAIRGRFRWNGPDELVFSPAEPLLGATNYTAKINEEVLRYSRFNDVKNADKVSFHTAPLQLQDARVSWVVDEGNRSRAVPRVQLQFNYPVQADAIKERMKLSPLFPPLV